MQRCDLNRKTNWGQKGFLKSYSGASFVGRGLVDGCCVMTPEKNGLRVSGGGMTLTNHRTLTSAGDYKL